MCMLDSQVIYKKRVRNLRGLLMGIPCLCIFSLPWVGLYEILTGKRHELDYPWWGQVLLALLYLGPAIVCLIAFPLWWFHWGLTVRVTGTHLEVWRGPFKNPWFSGSSAHLRKVLLKLDKIKTLMPVKVDAMHSWELAHGARTDWQSDSMPELRKMADAPGMYCGPRALQVTDTEGQSFNVGTSDPDALAAVLMEARPGITLEETEPSGSN